MAVQVSFYNECLAAWEPLLEPVIVEDEKTMWKVQVKVTIWGVTAFIWSLNAPYLKKKNVHKRHYTVVSGKLVNYH